MTKDEIKTILKVIETTYPNWHPNDAAKTVEVWEVLFRSYPAKVIQDALVRYIMSDTKGFAPAPGQIIACIDTGIQELSEQEAWSLVTKAISNSNYHSVEEFAKLPKEIQIAVGSAANLKELGQMDMSTVQSVEKSHFERNYRTAVERIRHEKQTPDGVRQMIEERKTAMIEDGQDGKN